MYSKLPLKNVFLRSFFAVFLIGMSGLSSSAQNSGTVQGAIWCDQDCNGLMDLGEAMIYGVDIKLFDTDGIQMSSTTSNERGFWGFDNLPFGEYYITVEDLRQKDFTPAYVGDDPAMDSDITESISTGSSDIFILSNDNTIINLNAGLKPIFGSVSGVVWNDIDKDGVRSPSESPISGIVVTLVDDLNNIKARQTTDLDGAYRFDGIFADDYRVVFERMPDFTFTNPDQGDEAFDSDVVDLIGGSTDLFSISNLGDQFQFDAGLFVMTAEVKGVVWEDLNQDGQRSDDEPLLQDLSINLLDNQEVIATVQTNSAGFYSFSDVLMGESYTIEIELSACLTLTAANQGPEESDSDFSEELNVAQTHNFAASENAQCMIFDAGLVATCADIVGLVWCDTNADGNQDQGEPAISDSEVRLFDGQSNTEIASTRSGTDGRYSFDDRAIGSYYLLFDQAENKIFSTTSDVTGQNGAGSTSLFDIDFGTKEITRNAGQISDLVRVQGRVWCDNNGDGIRELGESGVSNVSVALFVEDSGEIANTFTDANGRYDFSDIIDIENGSYYVVVSGINGKFFTAANQGLDRTMDSDITGANGVGSSDVFEITTDNRDVTIDAGIGIILANISGRIWDDKSLIGVQDDSSEGTFENLSINLFDLEDNLVTTVLSDSEGNYTFSDINFGTYYLQFPSQANYDFTEANLGSDAFDSDVTGSNGTGTTASFVLDATNVSIDLDAGYVRNDGSVSGIIWNDANQNGVLNSDESPVANIEVQLIDDANNLISTLSTNDDGEFLFADVPMGIYYIKVSNPSGTDFTVANTGNDDLIDSDIIGAIEPGASDLFVLLPGEEKDDLGAGLIFAANCFAGFVWEDLDGNGLFTADEPKLSGVRVVLFNSLEQGVNVAQTRADGSYKFTDLAEDFYYVRFDVNDPFEFTLFNQGNDEAIDSDVSGELGVGTSDTFAAGGEKNTTGVNAGIYRPASISGEAWLDQNNNQFQDNLDLMLFNIVVDLVDQNGTPVTDPKITSDGSYSFSGLRPGNYQVRFALDGNFEFVISDNGEDATNSDIMSTTANFGFTSQIFLLSNTALENIDAGVQPVEVATASFGDLVWEDLNGNGIQDIGEPGLNGVGVELIRPNGAIIETTITKNLGDGDGHYEFIDVEAQDYYIKFILPDGFEFTSAKRGNDDDLDSDVIGFNGVGTTVTYEITGQFTTTSVDAGMYRPVKIGNMVWNDANENGIFENNEIGVSSVRVRLFNATTNAQRAQQFTDSNGMYEFSVPPGDYYALFQISAGRQFTIANAGDDDNIDSDIDNSNGFGTTVTYSLESGAERFDVDGGMILQAADLGDYIWLDENADGIQDDDEFGFNDIDINLFDINNNFVTSTQSRVNLVNGQRGYYLFEGIPAGAYYVEFELPSGSVASLANQGGNDTRDSDITNAFGRGTTSMFQLDPSEEDFDVDGGFYFPSKIGDFIWEDLDKNGIQDAGEPGFPGVEISILSNGDVLETQFSDENGKYLFEGLRPGTYSIEIVRPTGFAYTAEGEGDDESLDNDFTPTGGSTPINLTQDIEFLDFDAGFIKITNFVGMNIYHDLNANGKREPVDAAIEEVTVELYGQDGNLVQSSKTDTLGEVAFEDVPYGEYYFKVINPSQYKFGDSNVHNQVDDSGYSGQFNFTAEDNNKALSASLYRPVEIYSKVWRDSNGNGIMEQGEPLIEDVAVNLIDEDGNIVLTERTGVYLPGTAVFRDVKPGLYSLTYEPNELYVPTEFHTDPNGMLDSDIAAVNGAFITPNYEFLSGDRISNTNAGFYFGSKVGDLVWLDDNGDGYQDKHEQGVADVVVSLMSPSGDVLQSVTTDAEGKYELAQITQGVYYVHFELPDGLTFTGGSQVLDSERDSDVDDSNGYGTTSFFGIAPEQEKLNVDASVALGGILSVDDVGLISGIHMETYNLLDLQPLNQVYVKEYQLQRSLGHLDGFQTIATFNANETVKFTFEDYNIQSGMHYYRFLEVNDDGIYKESRIVALDVADNTVAEALNLYPNPVSDILILDVPKESKLKAVKVWSQNGILVKQFTNHDHKLEQYQYTVSDLDAGQYYLELIHHNRSEIKEFQIIR